MGLDTTHGCWNGPYSVFNRWRKVIARVCGYDLTNMEGFEGPPTHPLAWPDPQVSPIVTLLNHSDCDGHIGVGDLARLADALDVAANDLREYADAANKFADGCRAALERGEPVEFH